MPEVYHPADGLDWKEWARKEREGLAFEAQGKKPIYASACGVYSYSSVCSCMGV